MLVFTYPQYRSLAKSLRPDLAIYYNFDDYRDNWPRWAAQMPEWELEAVALSGLTVCIARVRTAALKRSAPASAKDIVHMSLGTTASLMAGADGPSPTPLPDRLSGFRRPIAGHIGALNRRFDFQFLSAVSERLPEVTFVLGGREPSRTDGDSHWAIGLDAARRRSNVQFIGWVEHAELGPYLSACDVLFMCYTRCNFNTNANPAKLWDYMGSGRPIVGNENNPETLEWGHVVGIGGHAGTFAERLKEAIWSDSLEARKRRLDLANSMSWRALGARMREIILDRLGSSEDRTPERCVPAAPVSREPGTTP